MHIVEARISGGQAGPFDYRQGGEVLSPVKGPTASALTLTVVVTAESWEEGKLKRLKSEILNIAHHI